MESKQHALTGRTDLNDGALTRDYYSAIRRNGLSSHIWIQRNLKFISLSERMQAEKYIYFWLQEEVIMDVNQDFSDSN